MQTTVVNIRVEECDVYVGRGRGSRWGNEFSHRDGTLAKFKVGSVAEAIEGYRRQLWVKVGAGEVTLEDLAALRGKRLGCWCKPGPCHGDVLASAAEWAWTQLHVPYDGVANREQFEAETAHAAQSA